MENKIKPFGFKRNLDYFRENFIIMWKSMIEYKANFYNSLFIQLIFALIYFIYFSIISNEFGYLISWKFQDFLLFFLIYDTIFVLYGTFSWKWEDFKYTLTSGRLNNYIFRPFNPFFAYSFSKLSGAGFLMIIINLFIFPILFYFFEYEFSNIFFSFVVFCLICYGFFMLSSFFKSISFFSFGLSDSLQRLFYEFNEGVRTYPYSFFQNYSYSFLLFLFPMFFISSLLIPLLLGYEIWDINFQLLFLVLFNIVFTLLNLIMWHYGLKKYEAFG